jgi:hypothetical protein
MENRHHLNYLQQSYGNLINNKRVKLLRSIIAYDAEWHISEITEQHSFSQAVKLLPEIPDVVYFGFPWARLFDLIESDHAESNRILSDLASVKPLIKGKKYIITVCQHISFLKYKHIFDNLGISHVFWPHAGREMECIPGHNDFRVLPYPLAPTLTFDNFSTVNTVRKYLYSFFYQKTTEPHIFRLGNLIQNNLAVDKRSVVTSGNQCNFMDKGNIHILSAACEQQTQKTVKEFPLTESRQIMQDSIFSLCFSDPRPNSVRLWESISYNTIPVLFTDSIHLPGYKALWDEATVKCSERLEDIKALPNQLASLARDKTLLERKRKALRQLWLLYGPDWFIYDIYKLFLSLAQEKSKTAYTEHFLSYSKLLALASAINRRTIVQPSEIDFFILGCSSKVLTNPAGFLNRYEKNSGFRSAYIRAISSCNPRYSEAMQMNLKFQRIALN